MARPIGRAVSFPFHVQVSHRGRSRVRARRSVASYHLHRSRRRSCLSLPRTLGVWEVAYPRRESGEKRRVREERARSPTDRSFSRSWSIARLSLPSRKPTFYSRFNRCVAFSPSPSRRCVEFVERRERASAGRKDRAVLGNAGRWLSAGKQVTRSVGGTGEISRRDEHSGEEGAHSSAGERAPSALLSRSHLPPALSTLSRLLVDVRSHARRVSSSLDEKKRGAPRAIFIGALLDGRRARRATTTYRARYEFRRLAFSARDYRLVACRKGSSPLCD